MLLSNSNLLLPKLVYYRIIFEGGRNTFKINSVVYNKTAIFIFVIIISQRNLQEFWRLNRVYIYVKTICINHCWKFHTRNVIKTQNFHRHEFKRPLILSILKLLLCHILTPSHWLTHAAMGKFSVLLHNSGRCIYDDIVFLISGTLRATLHFNQLVRSDTRAFARKPYFRYAY